MACNIFQTQVERDSNGKLEKVRNHRGQESKLYKDILDHLRNNREEPSVYDGEYISSLIKEGYLVAESIVKAPIEEIALAYYSKIYSPSFKNYYGDWESTGNQREPTFEKVSSILFSRAVESQFDYGGLDYDPSVVTEVLNPMLEDLISEGMSVGEILEILAENGLTAPESVIERALQLKKSPTNKKTKQLRSDIRSEKYTAETLKALYGEYGYSDSEIDDLLDAYKNPKQNTQTGSLRENDSLENLDDQSKADALVRAVKNSVPQVMIDLFDRTKNYVDGDPMRRKMSGAKIKSRGDIKRLYRRLKSKNLIKRNQEGAGQSAQLKVLLLSLGEMMPALKESGISLIIHDSPSSYLNELEKHKLGDENHFNSSGFVTGNEVHIHAANPLIDGSVAAHEVLHPIIEQIFENNRGLYDQLKADVESDPTITETYLDLNADGTADPSMEEVINYLAKNLTESIVEKHTDLPENFDLAQVRSKDLDDTLFAKNKDYAARESSYLWLLFKKVINRVKEILGLPTSETDSNFDKIMDTRDSAYFLEDLKNHILTGRSVRVKSINNTQVRFSSATNRDDAIINVIAMHEDVFIDKDKNPTSALMKAKKGLGLNDGQLRGIIEKMYNIELDSERREGPEDFASPDTFEKRLLGGALKDGRKARTMKAYLSGKMRDVMPDSMMDEIFQTYLKTAYRNKPRKTRPSHTDMAKDLLAAELPIEVKYYMLSHFIARFESHIDNDISIEIVEKLRNLRTSWGRMGRYMQDSQNELFGPVEALVRERNGRSRSRRMKKTRDNILSALSMTKEEVQGMMNNFNEIQIKSLFTKLRLLGTEGSEVDIITAEELRSTVMSTGMKILTEAGVDVSDIIARGGIQKAKGDPKNKGVPNLDNLSQAKINQIIDAYIRLARGNTRQAQFMFEKSFGESVRKKHWALNDTLNQNAVQYSKQHAMETIRIGLNDIIGGKPATRNSPVLYTLREMLQINGYLVDSRDRPVPIDKAAKKLRNEMDLGTANMVTLIENSAMAMSNMMLRDDTRKNIKKRSQLKRARAKAYSLLGKVTMNESDYSDADQTLETISSLVSREIRDTLQDFFSNPNASLNRSNLAMRLIYQMGLPEGVALAVEKEVEDYIAATIKTEQRKNTVKKHTRDMEGADVEKIMQLASEGILDDQTLASTFPKAFSQADKPLPITVVAQLRKLRDDYIRSNTRYEKNKVFERAKKLIAKEYAGDSQLIDSIMNEIFYGNVLSGYSTMFNVVIGTLSQSMTIRLVQTSLDVTNIIKDLVLDPKMGKRRLGIIQKSINFQFFGMFKTENMKAAGEKVAELYTGDIGDLKSLEAERDPSQHASFNIWDDLVTRQFLDRARGIKRLFKGTPDDVMEGAKLLVRSFYTDDLGSEFANRKVANINGRRAISMGTAMLPLLAGGIGLAFGGGAIVLGTTALLTMVSPTIFSRSILVLDYFLKGNIERQSLVRNAAAMVEEEEGIDYSNEEFFQKMDQVMGRDPESLRNLDKVIDNDLMYAIEKYEDEYYEDNGTRPTVQDVDKFAKKYRRRRKLEMVTEYADEYLQDAARRQANTQTLTGLPAGRTGNIISGLNSWLAVRSPNEGAPAIERYGKLVANLTLKLALLPFANVMGHMVNLVYDSTFNAVSSGIGRLAGVRGSTAAGEIRQWNAQESRYEYIQLSPNELKFRMYRRLIAMTGLGLALLPQFLRGDDDDNDRDNPKMMGDEVDPSYYKSGFEVFGKRFRVTGSGGGMSFGDMQSLGDYSPLSLQVLNEETGLYENALDLANNIVPGMLLAPFGVKTDREIMRNKGLAVTDQELNSSISMGDVFTTYLALSVGQSFNQSTDVAFKTLQIMLPGSGAEDYEKTRARNEVLDQMTKPYQTLAKPNLMTQTYKVLSKFSDKKVKTYSDVTNRENASAFVWSRFTKSHPAFDPALQNKLTDALGYEIYQDYKVSEEVRTALYAMFGARFDEPRSKSPLYQVIDKDSRMPRPSSSGMMPEGGGGQKPYEYELPNVIPNTVYETSKSHRYRLMENDAFVTLMSDLLEKDLNSRTLSLAKDYLDPENELDMAEFEERVNNRLTTDNYVVAEQVMTAASRKAADEAKVEIFRDMFSEYLSADRRVLESWDDITDYMAENRLQIYEHDGNLVFSRQRGGSSKEKDRVYVPMERVNEDMKSLVQISNSRVVQPEDQ